MRAIGAALIIMKLFGAQMRQMSPPVSTSYLPPSSIILPATIHLILLSPAYKPYALPKVAPLISSPCLMRMLSLGVLGACASKPLVVSSIKLSLSPCPKLLRGASSSCAC